MHCAEKPRRKTEKNVNSLALELSQIWHFSVFAQKPNLSMATYLWCVSTWWICIYEIIMKQCSFIVSVWTCAYRFRWCRFQGLRPRMNFSLSIQIRKSMIHERVLHAKIVKEKTGRWSILRSQTLEPNSCLLLAKRKPNAEFDDFAFNKSPGFIIVTRKCRVIW